MNKEYIKKLIEENKHIVDFAEFGNGVSEEWISKAELRLGIIFPLSYKWWLQNYSGGTILGDEIYSVYEIDFDSVVGGDIVYINEISRKNKTNNVNQLIIQQNDFAQVYYFDLTLEENDGPVFVSDSEVPYAVNFISFLEKKIKEGEGK